MSLVPGSLSSLAHERSMGPAANVNRPAGCPRLQHRTERPLNSPGLQPGSNSSGLLLCPPPATRRPLNRRKAHAPPALEGVRHSGRCAAGSEVWHKSPGPGDALCRCRGSGCSAPKAVAGGGVVGDSDGPQAGRWARRQGRRCLSTTLPGSRGLAGRASSAHALHSEPAREVRPRRTPAASPPRRHPMRPT